MAELYKYGVAVTLYKPIIKRAVVDFALGADWTPAAGDVKISKDGGVAANVTNLPTALAMGNTALWLFSLTATEMQAAKVRITVSDAATKAVEDVAFEIDTYGNASAQHAVDLGDSIRAGLTALPNAAAEAAGGLYTRGTGAGQINQPANGMIDGNVVRWLGTAAATPATAGVPKVAIEAAGDFAQAAADKVWSSATRTLTSLGAALVQEVWDRATSALTTAGSIGKLLVDNVNATVSSRSSHSAADVWAVGTRALTDKAGFSLSAAGVQAIWDALTSALTTVGSIGKLLVDNINATLSSRSSHSAADVWAAGTRTLTAATNITSTGGTTVPQTGDSFARLGAAGAGLTAVPWNAAWDVEVQSEVEDALDVAVADSVPADGSRPSVRQALYMITQFLMEKSVSGTTVTVKKPDGSTALMTLTLDSSTDPTSITRAS